MGSPNIDVAAVTAAENSSPDGSGWAADECAAPADTAIIEVDSADAFAAETRRIETRVADGSAFAAPDTSAVRVSAATTSRLGDYRRYVRFPPPKCGKSAPDVSFHIP